MIAALVAVHIWAFHTTGNNNPTGVEVRRGSRKRPKGHPALLALFRDQGPVRAGVILVVFFAVVGFMPNYLGHPDNYIEANPLATPAHIVPEWYFLPFYAILRAFTADVWVVMLASWITFRHRRRQVLRRGWRCSARSCVMALVPWLDTSRDPSRASTVRCSSGGSGF